jgi:aryl-alcohol dehydrogenase-like predicted oxidoreductase
MDATEYRMRKERTMLRRALGTTGLEIAPLVLGGNVFGWTADEPTSFALLDAFVDAGLNAIDTADVYSRWLPGHQGGESETILGKWLKARPGAREKVLLFTKAGADMGDDRKGLSKRWLLQAAEDSLRRLQTDRIDLYQSHVPDPSTPQEETLAAYDILIKSGKVRAIGASNFSVDQLTDALRIADARHLPRYAVLQPEYNLYNREGYENGPRALAIRERLGVIPYFALAAGFLTGKYRSAQDFSKSPRGQMMGKYLNPRGERILSALDAVSARHRAQPAEVALAWLISRDGVTAPIASATSRAQLDSLVAATRLQLSAADQAELEAASTYEAVV